MIVTGGGTGGHLFPGIAVAEAVLEQFDGSEVLFVGTDRLIDQKALAGRKFKSTSISCGALKGKSLAGIFKTLIQLPASLFAAMKIIKKFRPQLVLGVGGYVTGPVVLAARMLGVKSCIHEQNSVPGMANRILGKIVNRIYISIPGSECYFPASKTVLTGNPIRKEILAQQDETTEKNEISPKTLLVLGGSQGAHRVNKLVVEAICGMEPGVQPKVIHQSGVHDEKWVGEAYEKGGVRARVAPFFTDMAQVYAQADLVVSRAGATTLAELTVLAKPSILIPYPYAADDHQTTNAQVLVQGEAARMFSEADLSGERLREEIETLCRDGAQLARMAQKAKALGLPAATQTIIDKSMELCACTTGCR